MANEFVPFVLPSKSDDESSVGLADAPDDAFLSIGDEAGLPSDEPSASTPLSIVPNPAFDHPHDAAPSITVERDGDRITRIEVRCKCGQVIELECD